ncbi:MAG: hypothetical protein ACXADB_06520 [Candidatus Hermodarchaeia archaeon]
MARWTKKSLTFPITGATAQVAFIDQLKRKLKLDFHIKANQRGITVTLRGDSEQVRTAVNRAQTLYRESKEDSYSSQIES